MFLFKGCPHVWEELAYILLCSGVKHQNCPLPPTPGAWVTLLVHTEKQHAV